VSNERPIGRWSKLCGGEEVSALEAGMDFRLPQYRREAFQRFYAFTLRHRIHPGCVYFALPALAASEHMDAEQYMWLCFLNGNTQNPVTSWLIMREFPTLQSTDHSLLGLWLSENWKRLDFDTDRRYWKTQLPECVARYQACVGDQPQLAYFHNVIRTFSDGALPTEYRAFTAVWQTVRDKFYGFGRLSAWSYIEYLRIAGLLTQPGDIMLDDRDGSRSHRNGLCKVLGRDDLDWHASNPAFNGKYTPEEVAWLGREAQLLLDEARQRAAWSDYLGDVNFFTLESALCTYKSCYRPNRRYPGVYADMMHDRIRRAEAKWRGTDFGVFWLMRSRSLPPYLLLERNPRDGGVCPVKQNLFRETGQYPMMDVDDAVFANEYSDVFLEKTEK
jgi:hypothetical protein